MTSDVQCIHGTSHDRCALCRLAMRRMAAGQPIERPRRHETQTGVPMPDWFRAQLAALGIRLQSDNGQAASTTSPRGTDA